MVHVGVNVYFKAPEIQCQHSLRSWRYCVVVKRDLAAEPLYEYDLMAEPSRAAKPREILPARGP